MPRAGDDSADGFPDAGAFPVLIIAVAHHGPRARLENRREPRYLRLRRFRASVRRSEIELAPHSAAVCGNAPTVSAQTQGPRPLPPPKASATWPLEKRGESRPEHLRAIVRTVTRLRGFRQDIIDERAGVAGADVVVEESGAPVLLVVRLKVVGNKLTELELVATRSAAEGLIFNIDGLSAPSEVMNYAPRPEQLSTRDEAVKAALHYPAGLNAAKTFADVDAPFAAGAYRYENGQVMAGPDCKFAPGCQNIETQSLAIFNRLGNVQTRVVAVDERMGIVCLRMAWGVRERGGDQLTVWETFKIYDGKIHAVEAFMRILPVAKRNGGWD